jgi:hypothetical protein
LSPSIRWCTPDQPRAEERCSIVHGLEDPRQAENGLAFARLALREGFAAQTCFVCPQTAEKALKAIVYGGGERLVSVTRWSSSSTGCAPGLRRSPRCVRLPACWNPNGPAGGLPSRRQAEEAVEHAERLVGGARDSIDGGAVGAP